MKADPHGAGDAMGSAPLVDADLDVRVGSLALRAAFSIDPGTTLAIVGPNGAGKSTLLRVLAGLTPLDQGQLTIAGRVVDDPARSVWRGPAARRVSIVFQDHRLFPHLSALDNVAYGVGERQRRLRRQAAQSWLDRVAPGVDPSARPGTLSGGQAQRVAIARALATEPDVVLLDEPLAAVDAGARPAMRSLLAEIEATKVLVSHDPVDARLLGDRLIVLEDGRVTHAGEPAAVAARPRTAWVAELLGRNLLAGRSTGTTVELPTGASLQTAVRLDGAALVTFAPSAITLSRQRPSGSARNVWSTTVAELVPDAERVRVRLDVPVPAWATITPSAVAELGLAVGETVVAAVKATELAVEPAG